MRPKRYHYQFRMPVAPLPDYLPLTATFTRYHGSFCSIGRHFWGGEAVKRRVSALPQAGVTFRVAGPCALIARSTSQSITNSVSYPAMDPDKPSYHVQPPSGWLNDGNGFIYFKGRYHMFYQHIPGSSDWAWRMCWGHCSSVDLIHWEHDPIALRPTLGGPDDKGCWSGCCAVDQAGIPVILYTGVRLGAGPNQLAREEDAISQPVIETQCAATCSLGDDRLCRWTKVESIIAAPPPSLPVTGFRDPYVIQTGGNGRDWLLVIGSGIDNKGGALLLYRSQELSSGWEYVGPLCIGTQCSSDPFDTGAMWECPFFQQLSPQQPESDGQATTAGENYVMCVSPYPHVRQATTNRCLYWIGTFANLKFDIQNSHGPHVLDLGDELYAPNCFRDGKGRLLMAGWLQEGPSRDSSRFDYSGCLSLPRVLTLRGDRLHQAPAPELSGLRAPSTVWQSKETLVVTPEAAFPVPVGGPALSVDIHIDPAQSAAGALSVLLLSGESEDSGKSQASSAIAVSVDWTEATLKVHHLDAGAINKSSRSFDVAAASSSVGGTISSDLGAPIRMQLFLDHSVLEVFLDTGEALTTRVYHRTVPAASPDTAGIFLVAHDGDAAVVSAQAAQMNSIWPKA